jgi:hypothetical protein
MTFWTGLQWLGNNTKNWQIGSHQAKKLQSKGNNCQSEEIAYRTEEYFCQLFFIWLWLISRMHQKNKELNTKRTNNPINKWTNELNTQSQKKCKWPVNTWGNAPHPQSSRKCKSTWFWESVSPSHNGYHKNNGGKDVEEKEPSYTVGGIVI